MAAPTIDEVKSYLRIDHPDEDVTLALLIEAAEEYMAKAGVVNVDGALYKLAVLLHVSMHYENRNPDTKLEGYDQVFQHIIPKLKEGF